MSYLKIEKDNVSKEYILTDTFNKPYMHISGSLLPLTTNTTQGLHLNIEANNTTYRPLEYESISVSDTYYTSMVNSNGLSSTTALTRSSTSGESYETRASTSATSYLTSASNVGTGSTTTSGSKWYVSSSYTQSSISTYGTYYATSTSKTLCTYVIYFGQNFKYTVTSFNNARLYVYFSNTPYNTMFTVTISNTSSSFITYSNSKSNTSTSYSYNTITSFTNTRNTSRSTLLSLTATTGPLATPAATYSGSYTSSYSTAYYDSDYGNRTYTSLFTMYNTLSYISERAISTCNLHYSEEYDMLYIYIHTNTLSNQTRSTLSTRSSSYQPLSYISTYTRKQFIDKNITYTCTYYSGYAYYSAYAYKYTSIRTYKSGASTVYRTQTNSYTTSYGSNENAVGLYYSLFNQSNISGMENSYSNTMYSSYLYATYMSSTFANSILVTNIKSSIYSYPNSRSQTSSVSLKASLVTTSTSNVMVQTSSTIAVTTGTSYLTRSSASKTIYLTCSSTSAYSGVSSSSSESSGWN